MGWVSLSSELFFLQPCRAYRRVGKFLPLTWFFSFSASVRPKTCSGHVRLALSLIACCAEVRHYRGSGFMLWIILFFQLLGECSAKGMLGTCSFGVEFKCLLY